MWRIAKNLTWPFNWLNNEFLSFLIYFVSIDWIIFILVIVVLVQNILIILYEAPSNKYTNMGRVHVH